jgi:hypothetical protein
MLVDSNHGIYRGENPEPGKDVTESLTPRPELENNQDPQRRFSAKLRRNAAREECSYTDC